MTHEKDDPRHCGLDPLTTGDWDPFQEECYVHDGEFNALKDGNPKHSSFVVARNFIEGVAKTAAKGAYAVIFAVPYALIGGIGGMFRWKQLELRNEREDKNELR